MTLQLPPSKDLGLRHVLEGGLAVIRNEQLDDGRRRVILDRLIDILSEAERGSQAVQARNLLFATEQRSAFERFSLFFRYLNAPFGTTLPNRLSDARDVFGELRDRGASDNVRLQRAGELIEALLGAIKRDAALMRLEAPRRIQFG